MSSPAARRADAGAELPVFGWDGVFAFVLFLPMLFMAQLGTYGAVIVVAVTLGFAAVRRRSLPAVLRAQSFVLLFPAFMVVSTLWSEAPTETLKHALEFSVTVLAALLLASSRNPRSMLLGLFAAFLIFAAVSVAFGNTVDVGNYGARALSGLGESKNEAADMAGAGFVISTFLALAALGARRWLQFGLFAAAAALQVYVAVEALSSGAIAGMIAGFATLVVLMLLRRAGVAARAATLGIAGVSAIALAILFEISGNAILRWLATVFGKDRTLTGRTYLWLRAKDLVAEHPLLGRGFGAFWQQGNLDAEGLWRFAQITSRQGFNFHNTVYDVLVPLGWAGLVVFAIVLVLGLARAGRAYVLRPTLMACFWLTMAVYFMIRMPTECVGLIEFYFSTVLLFACLGSVRPLPVSRSVYRPSAPPFGTVPAGAASAAARFGVP